MTVLDDFMTELAQLRAENERLRRRCNEITVRNNRVVAGDSEETMLRKALLRDVHDAGERLLVAIGNEVRGMSEDTRDAASHLQQVLYAIRYDRRWEK